MGRDYVRLRDWARANSFEMSARAKGEDIRLTKEGATLSFSIDSQKAEINGVIILLSFPVAQRNNEALVTRLDLLKTVQPILFPPQKQAPSAIKTICIDAGHGGKDPGFLQGANQEKTYTLLIADEVKEQLTKAGFKVIMTRTHDKFVEREARPEIARKNKADLFVSLHFNSSPAAREVNGVEVYCFTPAGAPSSNAAGEAGYVEAVAANKFNDASLLLAYQLQRNLVHGLGMNDRGLHRARFAVLRLAPMPAVLIEGGFLSNPAESNRIFDSEWRKKLAKSICDGLLAYKKLAAPQNLRQPRAE